MSSARNNYYSRLIHELSAINKSGAINDLHYCPINCYYLGTTVLNVRARGTGGRAIVYGLDLPSGYEGIFNIDPVMGNITVGPNGTSRLIIRDHNPTVFMFDVFAYYLQAGPSGDRVRRPLKLVPIVIHYNHFISSICSHTYG